MEIVLIRHGKPTGAIYPRVSASGFADWVRKYDQSGIVVDNQPDPLSLIHISEPTRPY